MLLFHMIFEFKVQYLFDTRVAINTTIHLSILTIPKDYVHMHKIPTDNSQCGQVESNESENNIAGTFAG